MKWRKYKIRDFTIGRLRIYPYTIIVSGLTFFLVWSWYQRLPLLLTELQYTIIGAALIAVGVFFLFVESGTLYPSSAWATVYFICIAIGLAHLFHDISFNLSFLQNIKIPNLKEMI